MFRALVLIGSLTLSSLAQASPPQGLVLVEGARGVSPTVRSLEAAIQAAGLTLIAKVDHGEAARNAGQELRPTVLLIFGNPKAGTPVMQASQTAGIDLPLKVLIYQDEAGKTQLAYNDPAWIAARHSAEAAPTLPKMAQALPALVSTAAAPE